MRPERPADEKVDKALEMLVSLDERLESVERLCFAVCLVVGLFMVTLLFRINLVSYKAEHIALGPDAAASRATLDELVSSYYWSSQFFFLAAVCYLFATYYRGVKRQPKPARMLELVSAGCFAVGGLAFIYAGFRLRFVEEQVMVFVAVLMLAFVAFQVAVARAGAGR